MVLQRGMRVPVWGWAPPDSRVSVSIADQEKVAVTNSDGKWMTHLDPMQPGKPLTLRVNSAGAELEIRDVLVGDVFLCSGQSNMEFTVSQANRADVERLTAKYPLIRHFKVMQKVSPTPLEQTIGEWQVCSPETVYGFTAVGYFFARHLYRELKVPIGLIHASWGGTVAEAWTSEEALKGEPKLRSLFKNLNVKPSEIKRHQKLLAEWEAKAIAVDPGNKGFDRGWAAPKQDLKDWGEMELPTMWEKTGLNIDGAVWFRREVTVPPDWAGKDLQLSLGGIDDFDTTYFNGEQVGATGIETPNWWIHPRVYQIPGHLVQAGKNTIAVRVFDRFAAGGFVGPAGVMFLSLQDSPDEKKIRLRGIWKFRVELAIKPSSIPAPQLPPTPDLPNYPANLFRGMLAPLIPYAIRGAIWYQGESNARKAEEYKTLFPVMIQDWRNHWGQGDFPFLFVQLANYNEMVFWPHIRDAQLSALELPNTAVALAIDIGDAGDVHPKNKQDVGKRLALQALELIYGKDVVAFGPWPLDVSREGKTVVVEYENTEGKLDTQDGRAVTGFILEQKKRKVPAKAKIRGHQVILKARGVTKPTAVSYAYENNPRCNLTNVSGLPALPFRREI